MIVTKGDFRVIHTLSELERQSVINHFGKSSATTTQLQAAHKIATLAKASEAWIQCDCSGEQFPAYLFPRQSDTGAVTLVRPRPPRQNAHSSLCPFYLSDLPQANLIEHSSSSTRIQDFCLLKPDSLSVAAKKETPLAEPSTRAQQLPRLTRVLLNLLDAAGINHLDDGFPFSEYHRAIYRTTTNIPMWPGSSMMLSDVISTTSTTAHYFSLINRLKSEKRFGSKKRKQGYVISLAKSFTDFSLTLQSGQTINLLGKIAAPSRVPTGPYWAIILIAESRAGSNYFDAIRASLWPAYSEKLPFVVDSDPERHTLKELISWRLYWRDRGEDFAIIKPLDFSTPIKPDFIVLDKESGSQVVIETMGSKDESYLSRKVETHAQMAKIGPVIEHRVNDDSFQFKKALTAAVMR